jgi:hypothetical protein
MAAVHPGCTLRSAWMYVYHGEVRAHHVAA